MGYGVMAHAVDPNLWDLVGSGADAVLGTLVPRADRAAASIDGLLADQVADPPRPAALDLLRHLVLGEPYDQRAGFAYGYWLEFLCEVYGRSLPNNAWMPIRIDFIGQVQSALAAAGVPAQSLSVDAMVFGGPPVPLPPIDDFPGIGVTPTDRAADGLRHLRAADLSTVEDEDVREAVDQLASWLTTCAEGGHQLVCFYH